jgi:crotonobetainyl-CoA:carnitine CoA-transferase CaiB-like acyl-CoA transferase
MGPLTGLKVVDLTHVMAGPTCTLMLADMGAEVIKIEKIPAGDDTRYMVPPRIGDEAASFLMMNRNKKGIALDLKTARGAKVLRRLIGSAIAKRSRCFCRWCARIPSPDCRAVRCLSPSL